MFVRFCGKGVEHDEQRTIPGARLASPAGRSAHDGRAQPAGLAWHGADKTIKTLADLSNHTIIYSFGAGFWDYMKNKYHYKNIKEVNYDFTLRRFLATPNAVNQCYITSEPYTALHSGHRVKAALIASTGYNPYGDVMVTNESEL